MLSFGFFNLEYSPNCNSDFLEVRQDGQGGRVLGRYCGSQIPTNQTMGNRLWIRFKSNENIPGRGFMATYNSIYGGELNGNTGQVTSPLYPNNYPHGVDYTWVITVDLGFRIVATFQDMHTERDPSCSFDFVRLRDGSSANSRELGRYCGIIVPQPVVTTSNQLRVEFQSDSSVSGRGFRMTWQAYNGTAVLPEVSTPAIPVNRTGCGGYPIANDSFQTITSPGFPEPYEEGLDCSWYISTSQENSILFEFTNLSLPGNPPRCFDGVIIQTVYRPGGQMMGYYPSYSYNSFCGAVLPTRPLIMRNSVVQVRFRTFVGRNTDRSFLGFSLNFKAVCGNRIQGSRGNLKSPGYPNNYPDGTNCTWTFVVPVGRTVQASFSGSFGISGQPGQCSADYIQVFNGGDTTSPSLGRFCGNQAPAIPQSASNQLTLSFFSNSDGVSGSGFNLSYSEVLLACGGSVLLTDVMKESFLASPNYPQNYPPNVDCIWIVTAPANRRVRADFVQPFSIEANQRCEYDFVELRDGGTSNSPLLGRFCGNLLPGTKEAAGNVMHVRFRTDGSVTQRGFQARVSYDICGGSINAQNGSISSPNYPANYPTNVDCEWFIQGATGHYLTLQIEAFRINSSPNCTTDYVEVREFNSSGPIKFRSCGTRPPTAFDTSDSYAYVKFHSSNQQTYSGFRINFISSVEACGGQLTTPYGTITSPGYPRAYAHSRVCEWVIRVAEGRKISLVFNDMDLERGYVRFCTNDYVEVRNGILPGSPIIGRYCGTTVPTSSIESSSNAMTVKFVANERYNGRGFSAAYSSDSPSECGGVLNATDNSGIIESPNFSQNVTYNASEQCIWVLTNRNQNSSIAIRFLTLDLEAQGECSYDFIEIREGSDENGDLIGRFCRFDRSVLPLVISPLPVIWMRFVSDLISQRTGFQLSYTFTDCGGVLTSSNGVITSPNFPSMYNSDTYCVWKIVAPEGSQVKIRFQRLVFNPSNTSNCSAVYLEVFNGGLPSSPSAGKYCSGPPPIFRSQSNQVRLVFYAGPNAIPARGFRVSYMVDTIGCGGSIHSQEGVITSPNWPSSYNNSLECIWDITVANGYHILWQFSPPFAMEISNPCTGDFVEISEISSSGQPTQIGRYCGNELPSPGASRSNKIQIKFRSNAQNQDNGFALNFTAGCGATFTERQGMIMSPGYPNNYANNLNCTYEIVGDPQKYIVLTFDPDHFHVEGGWRSRFKIYNPSFQWNMRRGYRRCYFDAVEVFSVINSTQSRLGVFCGDTAPQPVGTFGGIIIKFTTDDSGTDIGWIANYEQSECGGQLTDPSGTITSPSHPQSYISNANCTWIITAPQNKNIKLSFQTFNLEAHSQCRFDYVAIYDGSQEDPSRLIGRYCGSALPVPALSLTNSMMIRFISDSSDQREGFSAIYTSIYGPSVGCGGLINLTSGSIQSIDVNNDSIYETDLECVWQLTVPQNSTIFIQFTRFNLVPAGCYDFLEVRDGLFSTDPLVGKLCGGATPSNYTSTTNMLYIKFVTDGSNGASGFSLQFTAVARLCGSTLYSSNVSRVISSPNYPLPYAPNVNCRWTIDAPVNEQVEITVTALDIDNHTNCDNGYLEIRDIIMDQNAAQRAGLPQRILVCGNNIPQPFYSSMQTVSVRFATRETGSGVRTGFQLNYKTATCNRTYTSSSGWVTSPRHPNNYPHNVNCHTIIRTPPGNKLSIFFADLQIERYNQRCIHDYLKVYNGSGPTSPSVALLCGFTIPSPIFLSQNEARLVFVTDSSTTYRGFALTYTSSETGCGGTLNSPLGTFTSPDYPRNINYATSCQWSIAVAPGSNVNFQITVQQSRGGNSVDDCTNSGVTVYDGPTTLSSSVTYCTSEGLVNFRANSNRLTVVFSSSNSPNATNIAFRANYRS